MKLLSIQAFSLFRNGGGSRVLRRLYEGNEKQILCICFQETQRIHNSASIEEKIVHIYPPLKKWMRWRLRNLNSVLQKKIFYNKNSNNIKRSAENVDYSILHIVSHGIFASVFNEDFYTQGKQLWVSFHDYYTTTDISFENTYRLWNRANRRLVISLELGYKYQELFGFREFEIITDGVSKEEISEPNINIHKNITIYFAGLLHIDYIPLFNILAEAIEELSEEGLLFNLVLRGTQELPFLHNRSFQVEYKNDFISDEFLKKEIDSASILYLPIKFSDPDFYLYSLSTKMVSYLGGAGAILYHGPSDSAAYNLLKSNNSAICCTTLKVTDMVRSIKLLITSSNSISNNAKELAKSEFSLEKIRDCFWQRS